MDQSLTIIEQKNVEFYDDELVAVRASDGHVYVSVRHLSDSLGLDQTGQIRRIRRQPVLEKGCFKGFIITPGGRQPANWLRVDLVPLYMAGVSTKSVKDEIRPKLEKFQDEAAKVLWEAFQEGRLTSDPSFEALLETDSPAVQAYKTFQALTKLARGQIILESRLEDHEKRLEQIEATLGDPGRAIQPDQASQLSQAVKAVALVLGRQTGRNEYGGVYGELYRREGITSYKLLPAHRFEPVMQWLTGWYQELTGSADTPF